MINFFFRKKRFTVFLSAMFLWFGLQSYQKIAKEGAPQVKVPYIYISISAEGFAPNDSERMILKPLEKELSKIRGVKNITSYAQINTSSAVVEFDAGFDTAVALQEVRDKTDTAKGDFPAEVDEPVISEVDFSAMPVLNVALLSDSTSKIMQNAREIQDRIEAIPEVLKVEIKGEEVESVEVRISPLTLRQFNLTVNDIIAIQSNNKLISAGKLRLSTGEFSINVPSLVRNIQDIANLPIALKDGSVVKLKDIATIKQTYKDRTSIARINGKKAIVLEVSKRSGENIINTIAKVRQSIDEYAQTIGDNLQIIYMRDTSSDIEDSLNNLQNNIILAVFIVFLMVMNLVGYRQAFLIGLSVPLSFFIAIWIFYLCGMSLNIVVLFGLVLSVGIIVDAASVIVEYAKQKIDEGIPASKAYLVSARKMLIPVTVSTVTVLIVSAPLLLFPGIIGSFMKYLPLTLIVVLASSLFVALCIIPTFGALFDKSSSVENKDAIQNTLVSDIIQMRGIVGFYARIVAKTLEYPLRSLIILLSMIITIIAMYVTFNRGVEFFPDIETNYIRAFVRGTGNISLSEKEKIMNSVTKKVVKEVGNEIDVYYTTAGQTGGNSENVPKDAIGIIDIQLKDWQVRRPAKDIIEDLRKFVTEDGFIINFDKEKDGPPQSTDIYYEVFGSSSLTIERAIAEMKEVLEEKPFLRNIEDTKAPQRIEYKVLVNKPLAMRYGVNSTLLSSYIKLSTNGVMLDEYSADHLDEKTEILLRYGSDERGIEKISNGFIVNGGSVIPVANFIDVVESDELVEIVRKNGKAMLAIKADIKDFYVDDVGQKISVVKSLEKDNIFKELQSIASKYGVLLYAGGTDEDQKETMEFLSNAFLIAIVIIFLVFLVEFNSFGYAIIIVSSVFLSIVGVLLGFIISQSPLGIVMCGIGIVSLAGIVVSNNLIYIDFFQTLHAKSDNDTKQALVKAALLRAKPIILTSGTTIVGLLPAMFGIGIDFATGVVTINSPTSQWWTQLSSAIAGGLLFSTLLTLFFTPSNVLLYLRSKSYVQKRFNSFGRKFNFK